MNRIFTIMAIVASLGLFAQEGPKISSAIIQLNNNRDLAGAKEYIDEATVVIRNKSASEVREKDMSKYLYYNGLIHLRIANNKDPEIQKLDSNALDIAAESFKKLLAFEEKTGKERFTEETREQLPYVANMYAQRGIGKASAGAHMAAYKDFLITYELKKELGMGTDTSMYYNAALMAQNAGELEKSLTIYEALIEMDYRGLIYKGTSVESGEVVEFPSRKALNRMVQQKKVKDPVVEGDLRPIFMSNAANLYLATGDTTQYDAMVAEGRKMFPEK
ncbi:MAG: hypothetical protein U5L96_21985 [Owenweeksia sp.]|nr:hypothetical protein [Owenweeksia sp.]